MGSRLLMQWLKQPLKDLDMIQERLDLVEIFYEDQNMTKELRYDHFVLLVRPCQDQLFSSYP